MREIKAARILCRAARCRSCGGDPKRQWRFGDVAQPYPNQIFAQQRRARRFFLVRREKTRTDCFHAPCADVGNAHRLSPMGGAIQRARLERVFRSFAVSLLARAARLLEWRARDYG